MAYYGYDIPQDDTWQILNQLQTQFMGPTGNPLYTPQVMQGANFPNMVGAIYRAMSGVKGMKQQKAQIEADRVWQKKMYETELGIRNQAAQPKMAAPKGYQVPPDTMKEVAEYFKFPEGDWEQYDPAMQEQMVKEYLGATTAASKSLGGRAVKARGLSKLQLIKFASDKLENLAKVRESRANTIASNPLAQAALGVSISDLDQQAMFFRRAANQVMQMGFEMDENGNLPPEKEKRLRNYLQNPEGIASGVSHGLPPEERPGTRIPPDVLAAAKKKRPDLSDEEIIRLWQASKKK